MATATATRMAKMRDKNNDLAEASHCFIHFFAVTA